MDFLQLKVEFERVYSIVKNVSGTNPEMILKNYYHLIDRNYPVLDIGAGEGRHSIFLAKRGYNVHAIDPSEAACNTIEEIASAKDLPIKVYKKKFSTFKPDAKDYSAVLLFGLVQVLKWDEIKNLVTRLKKWTHKGSFLFITSWTVNDPAYVKNKNEWRKVGKNSYKNTDGGIYTFLEKDEILKLFKNWDVIHHWEGLGPIHSHGDQKLERHGRVEAILQRK